MPTFYRVPTFEYEIVVDEKFLYTYAIKQRPKKANKASIEYNIVYIGS